MFGFGFAFDGAGTAGVAITPARRAETDALVARMSPAPAAGRIDLIDGLIGALIDAGVWAKLDLLAVLAAHSAQASLLNWKGTGFAATTVGAPIFVTDRGWFTDGSDDFLDWGFAPAAGALFQQNSASYGAWFRKGDRNASTPIGTQTGATCTLNPRTSTDLVAGRINSSSVSAGATVTSGYGLAAIDRAAAAVQCYRNGAASGGTSTAASATRSSATMASGKANGVFSDGQFCAHFAGGSLTAAQHLALFDALNAYLAAIGVAAIVPASRTLSLTAAYPLPDGAAPVATGKRMAATGLARDPVDASWWVANGLATAQPTAGVSRLDATLTTIIAQYTVAGWGLGSAYNGSMQGAAFDPGDNTL